ncbi:hypothetical protein LSCM1_05640 [Leishmania martiniquensis]|uniref:Uncharacterized protein n=1 Tax=Leishmania martiniquensis TaxID=1580590 RepID=A0A836HS50_9TRYP|nr:hypothetical protein LSCM1_05640 [Leishmania martiniquensis]
MSQPFAPSSSSQRSHTTPRRQKDWCTLLRLLQEVQQLMEQRLEAVEIELQCLEAFRGSIVSEMHSDASPSQRSIAVLYPKGNGRRDREEAPLVGYLTACRSQRIEVSSRVFSPFREAGLYLTSKNRIVRVAPLALSEDEKARQEVEHLLPSSSPVGVVKTKAFPSAGLARLLAALTAAGLDKADFTLSGTSVGRCLSVHANPEPRDVAALCAAVPEKQVRALFDDNMGDFGAIASSLYTYMAEQATIQGMVLPAMRKRSVKLLRLPPSRQQLQLETIIWSLRKCCDCSDRDLVESSHIQWCKALQTTALEGRMRTSRKRSAYATGYSQLLQGLKAVSRVRQGYLVLVLTVCGDFFDLLDAGTLPLQRRNGLFAFRGMLATPHESERFSGPPLPSWTSEGNRTEIFHAE